jgi:hypothetical protein
VLGVSPSPLGTGRRPVDIPEAEPGGGSCGRDLPPRSRATSGFPVGRALRPVDRPVSRRRRGGAPRGARPLESPSDDGGLPRGRGTPRQVFLRAYVTGTQRCGDPHQRLSALRPLMPEGKDAKPGRSGRECGRRNGEALLFDIVNRKTNRGANAPLDHPLRPAKRRRNDARQCFAVVVTRQHCPQSTRCSSQCLGRRRSSLMSS